MLWQRCYNQRQNLLVYRNFSLDAAEKYSPLTANMTDTLLYFIISRCATFTRREITHNKRVTVRETCSCGKRASPLDANLMDIIHTSGANDDRLYRGALS